MTRFDAFFLQTWFVKTRRNASYVQSIGRLRHFINESDLNLIYKSIIIPHFDYGDMVWQSATKSSLSLLQKLQNRAGRLIMKVNPYSHTSN